MDYTIREMTTADWEAVRDIYSKALDEGKSSFRTQCPSYDEWNVGHVADCRYVVDCDGKVAGWIALSPTSTRSVYAGVVEVSIYLDKNYRNKGLGTKLLQYVCEDSERKGYWCLYASIFSSNEASISMHKKCGFRTIGYREKIAKDKWGEWQDTVLMEKRSKVI